MSYKSRTSTVVSPADVRAHAAANGVQVGGRGRMSIALFVSYLAANPSVLAKVADEKGIARPKSVKKGAKSTLALAEVVAPTLR